MSSRTTYMGIFSAPETNIEIEVSQIDLLELTFHAKFLRKLQS